MGKTFKAIFGGTEKQETSGPTDVTPPEVAGLRKSFTETLGQLFGSGTGDPLSGIPTSGVTGDNRVAQITGGETSVIQRILDDLKGPRQELLGQTLQGNFLPGQPGSNPFLQATIEAAQRPTKEALFETLDRTLPGRFTAAGQFVQPQGSSAFDRAAAIATRGSAQALADIATNISFGSQEAERGRQQEAIQLGQQEIQVLTQSLEAVALPRLIEDLGIERGLQEFQTRLSAVLEALRVATGTPLQTVAQESQGTSEQTGGIIPALTPIIAKR